MGTQGGAPLYQEDYEIQTEQDLMEGAPSTRRGPPGIRKT